MKVSTQFSVFMAVVFAAVCFSVAITGFTSLGEISDAAQLADAKGFAWFWAFLGTLGLVFAGVGIWLLRTSKEG
jgi:uncharacterized membrane protein